MHIAVTLPGALLKYTPCFSKPYAHACSLLLLLQVAGTRLKVFQRTAQDFPLLRRNLVCITAHCCCCCCCCLLLLLLLLPAAAAAAVAGDWHAAEGLPCTLQGGTTQQHIQLPQAVHRGAYF
jgi:hypothetical protein